MPWNSSIAVFSISPTTPPNEMSPASLMPALTIASIAISAEASPLFMLLAPSPKIQPSRDRLGPESVAGEMLLVAGIGRVHMAGEQQIEPVAAAAQMADGVRPAFVDQRQIGRPFRTCACARPDNARRRSPCRSGSRCSRGRSRQSRTVVGCDVSGGSGEVGMRHGCPFRRVDDRSLFFRRLDDGIVARRVEPDQVPRLLHVRRQRRGDVDRAAARMRHRLFVAPAGAAGSGCRPEIPNSP